MVPLTGLLAAGLHVNTSDHGQPSSMDDQVDDYGRASEHPSRARLTELEQQVAVLRAELSGARAVAEERAKRAETAERALLMLEAHNPRPDSFANVSPRPMSPPPLPQLQHHRRQHQARNHVPVGGVAGHSDGPTARVLAAQAGAALGKRGAPRAPRTRGPLT